MELLGLAVEEVIIDLLGLAAQGDAVIPGNQEHSPFEHFRDDLLIFQQCAGVDMEFAIVDLNLIVKPEIIQRSFGFFGQFAFVKTHDASISFR